MKSLVWLLCWQIKQSIFIRIPIIILIWLEPEEDCTYSFNISTTSAIVTAAAGVSVAKHGNRSISSKSGAGDVLEQLGVNIMMEPEKVEACVDEVGIGFMFAQTFNKSMRFVGQARSEMGIRTVFNILGPSGKPIRSKGYARRCL